MFPRNLTLLRLSAATAAAIATQLQTGAGAALAEHPLKPIGGLEMQTLGFMPPLGDDAYVQEAGSTLWLQLGIESKILPAAAISTELTKRVAALEAAEGRRLGGKARRRLREELLHELLPRALSKRSHLQAFIDHRAGFIAVDTAARRAAEQLLTELRKALGSVPAVPVNAEVAPRAVLTGWLSGEPLPEGLALGDECVLADPVDHGAAVRCTRQELQAEEIAKHLEAGKQCTRLALTLDDHLSFVLCDDLVIRKLRFLDSAVNSLEDTDRDSVAAELLARLGLVHVELRRLFEVVGAALRFSVED